jgi:AAA15 family ATPase/GTPase
MSMIVGANNGGKSTIIEALHSISDVSLSFSEDKRNVETDSRIEIIATDGAGNTVQRSTVQRGGSETEVIYSSNDSS